MVRLAAHGVIAGMLLVVGACNQVLGLDEPAVGLLALAPSRGVLEPPFETGVHDYTVALSPLTYEATVTAVATGDATVSLDPPAPAALVPGEPRTVTVAASADGETSTYTVTFTRGAHPPEIEMLTAPAPMAGAGFGRGLAIEGDRLVVGAPEENIGGTAEECDGNAMTPPLPPRGAIYIYERTAAGYQLEQRIPAPPMARCSAFGETLALSGDLLVVGGFRELRQVAYYFAGTAYVYRRVAPGNWMFVTELRPSIAYYGQSFGYDVATDGRRIIVGAHGEADGNNANAGVLHVFSADDGFLTPRRIARAGAVNDFWGFQVEIDGDGVLATAFGDDKAAADSGAIIPIDANLVPGDLIKAAQPMASEYLGQALKLNGDTMIVGTPSPSGVWGVNLGAAYVFRRDGSQWTDAMRLSRDVGTASDRFGIQVALSGDMFVVGACLGAGAGASGGWSPTDAAGTLAEAGFAVVYREVGRDAVELLGVASSPAPVAGARFSCDLVADGDRIVAGASLESTTDAPAAGVVYIFQ
jgi:hypothetical protein